MEKKDFNLTSARNRIPAESFRPWMSLCLLAAAIYNLAWGTWVVLFPNQFFDLLNLPRVNYPAIWQCVGMIVGVYGIGYAIAARDPFRHWPIILVGFLGKVFGPVGFLVGYLTDQLPPVFGLMCITNDLIWWIPFAVILYQGFRWNTDTGRGFAVPEFEQAISSFRTQRDESLRHLSGQQPTIVVFLRHSGCTFCRVTLADLVIAREAIRKSEVNIAIVHMGSPMEGTTMLAKYDLNYWHHISDPNCVLYRAFGLGRGTVGQLFSWSVFKRGVLAAFVGGHGVGKLHGDGFRMPGVFVLNHGRIIEQQVAIDAGSKVNYVDLAFKAAALRTRIDMKALVGSDQ